MNNILETANELINGERQSDYGNCVQNFSRVAEYWCMYLSHTKNIDIDLINIYDVAMMMTLFKLARLENNLKYDISNYKEDNLIDMCGYIALFDEMHKQLNNG